MGNSLPRIVALCGRPGSGKTEAQKILLEELGYIPVDDGRPLRKMAIDYLGLTEHQVTTAEGKAEYVEINGQRWQVRDILGELGNAWEEKFGGDIIPLMAFQMFKIGRDVNKEHYSFGSVRRKQGHWYKERGGVVLEIRRDHDRLDWIQQYEFDSFDPTAVDAVVINDGADRALLRSRLLYALKWLTYGEPAEGRLGEEYPWTEVGLDTSGRMYRGRDGVLVLDPAG